MSGLQSGIGVLLDVRAGKPRPAGLKCFREAPPGPKNTGAESARADIKGSRRLLIGELAPDDEQERIALLHRKVAEGVGEFGRHRRVEMLDDARRLSNQLGDRLQSALLEATVIGDHVIGDPQKPRQSSPMVTAAASPTAKTLVRTFPRRDLRLPRPQPVAPHSRAPGGGDVRRPERTGPAPAPIARAARRHQSAGSRFVCRNPPAENSRSHASGQGCRSYGAGVGGRPRLVDCYYGGCDRPVRQRRLGGRVLDKGGGPLRGSTGGIPEDGSLDAIAGPRVRWRRVSRAGV